MDLYKKTAAELHKLLQSKEISAAELTKNIFARIDEKESDIGAYLEMMKKFRAEKKFLRLKVFPARLKITFARKELKQLVRRRFLKILFRRTTRQLSRS